MSDDPIVDRVIKLEVSLSSLRTDVQWLKKLVGIQILLLTINLISLLIVVVTR